jgi:RNAse (barnase) inhibitor barstar
MRTEDLFVSMRPWVGCVVAEHNKLSAKVRGMRAKYATIPAFVGTLSGRKMRTRKGVFDQFSTLLQFPEYFGNNWNAFSDCIRDLDWLDAISFLIILIDADEVLEKGDADEFGLLVDILLEAGESWCTPDQFRPSKPFHVLLHATPERRAILERRLLTAGRDESPCMVDLE